MPSPAAAGVVGRDGVRLAVSAARAIRRRLRAVAVVLVPAALMVSTIRFRSFKTHQLRLEPVVHAARSCSPVLIAFIATEPRITLVILAYGYLLSAFVEWRLTRLRAPRAEAPPAA